MRRSVGIVAAEVDVHVVNAAPVALALIAVCVIGLAVWYFARRKPGKK